MAISFILLGLLVFSAGVLNRPNEKRCAPKYLFELDTLTDSSISDCNKKIDMLKYVPEFTEDKYELNDNANSVRFSEFGMQTDVEKFMESIKPRIYQQARENTADDFNAAIITGTLYDPFEEEENLFQDLCVIIGAFLATFAAVLLVCFCISTGYDACSKWCDFLFSFRKVRKMLPAAEEAQYQQIIEVEEDCETYV
ncbi:unnamed protein product [Diabrotica balteata]|uniref:Uncharacterized protein n=1 Tax=Diabrotica balteata TaxID=107213 RepID=A0A9N9X7U7_DIABA|nr:unnamed protein product [Diabrotica balteata]